MTTIYYIIQNHIILSNKIAAPIDMVDIGVFVFTARILAQLHTGTKDPYPAGLFATTIGATSFQAPWWKERISDDH